MLKNEKSVSAAARRVTVSLSVSLFGSGSGLRVVSRMMVCKANGCLVCGCVVSARRVSGVLVVDDCSSWACAVARLFSVAQSVMKALMFWMSSVDWVRLGSSVRTSVWIAGIRLGNSKPRCLCMDLERSSCRLLISCRDF